jgi:hypothetical protein
MSEQREIVTSEKLGRIVPDDKFREAVISLKDFIEAHRMFGSISDEKLNELSNIHNQFVRLTRKPNGMDLL